MMTIIVSRLYNTVEPQLSEPTGRQTIRSDKQGVRIGEMEFWEIVCPGCISETARCRKLILGRDIG